jgi:threonine synthase
MVASWHLRCIRCGETDHPLAPPPLSCHRCGGTWLEPIFDYAAIGPRLKELIRDRRPTMWRWRELLPLADDANLISLGEGATPLLRLKNLGLMLGMPNIYLKDERQGPTNSFKDRQASLAISVMKEHGVREAVVASTGNVAIAYSAYCAQASIKLWAFVTSTVPSDKMREVALYGTEVVKVTATYDRTKQVAAQFAERKRLHLDRGIRSIAARESMKTMAFEICEDLGWRAPDWYIQAVSGGMGPAGVWKGFWELHQMGLIDRMPKLASIQAEGCAPMVHAWEAELPKAHPVTNPRTRIATVATGDPGIAYEYLYERARESGGTFVAVSDESAFQAMHIMAKMDGFSMEPAAAMACAGAIKMVRTGQIKPHETVVICCSGHTFPAEKHLFDENWTHDIDLSYEPPAETPAAVSVRPPEEGLLVSLEQLGSRVRSIAIIEDDIDSSRLLRRILQAQGDYEIMEAHNGQDGITMVERHRPDLILLDLMMPEVDGFQVIDHLKADPALHDIPIIVITAATLTTAERMRLGAHVHSLLRKGTFVDSELLADINAALL